MPDWNWVQHKKESTEIFLEKKVFEENGKKGFGQE